MVTQVDAVVDARTSDLDLPATMAQAEDEARFAERRRIALMEPEAALRSVLVRTLLRLGCIISLTRNPQQLIELLQDGMLDGAVVALEADSLWAARLHAVNSRRVPIVILGDSPPGPYVTKQLSSLYFLQKPFDTRELLEHLHLPEKAKTTGAG